MELWQTPEAGRIYWCDQTGWDNDVGRSLGGLRIDVSHPYDRATCGHSTCGVHAIRLLQHGLLFWIQLLVTPHSPNRS